MAARGFVPPHPLPENLDAWTAFMRTANCRHFTMGGAGPANWADVRTILELYGLWRVGVHSRLSICFNELMLMEAEQRKAEANG